MWLQWETGADAQKTCRICFRAFMGVTLICCHGDAEVMLVMVLMMMVGVLNRCVVAAVSQKKRRRIIFWASFRGWVPCHGDDDVDGDADADNMVMPLMTFILCC